MGERERREAVRVQIASDLHLETWDGGCPRSVLDPDPDRDLLILAGDIDVGLAAKDRVAEWAEAAPVVYVMGNHEHYSPADHEEIDHWWSLTAAQVPGLHVLNGEAREVAGLTVWGGIWCSALRAPGVPGAQGIVARHINDFVAPRNDHGRWTTTRHRETHAEHSASLERHAGALDVVVTHFPPTRRAIHRRYRGRGRETRAMNAYFVNDAEDLVERVGAALWVSGHVHDPYRVQVGRTLCIGNPAGYGFHRRREGFSARCVEQVRPKREAAARQAGG